MIEIKHISKSFGNEKVLNGISTCFESGKTNLIIGRSGSGKTVLLKCIIGLLVPDEGEVLYDGRNFITLSKQEKADICREMGMLFQGAALFDSMNVLENVLFPLNMFSPLQQAERLQRAEFCLERVGMFNAKLKMPNELSGGMQKRVAIARAIALNPRYLFCDEPNSGIDPISSLRIDDLIHEITCEYGMTTLINTHDMNSVMGIGENILFIHEGKCEWKGNKAELFHSENEPLNQFVFATQWAQKFKKSKDYPY